MMSDGFKQLDTAKDWYCSACGYYFSKSKWIIVVKPHRGGHDVAICPYCKQARGIPRSD
jgi:hypothetical protein